MDAFHSPDARVAQPVFIGILWTCTSLSLCFLIFRLFVRIKAFGKLLSDDYFVIVAWILLVAYSALWQKHAPTMYDQYAITSGKLMPYIEFIKKDEDFLHAIVPLTILFYSCLWSVKLGFLFFFKRIGYEIRIHKIWWWCVLFVTLTAYIGCISDINYKCSLKSIFYIQANCQSLKTIHWNNRTFYANCALDVLSDLCILSIPIMMLWKVRIPLKKKLALFAIFSAIIVVVVVSIIRVTIVNSVDTNVDISWLYLWSNIEMGTSIIIACVASFRQLFVQTKNEQIRVKQPTSAQTSAWSRRGLMSYFTSTNRSQKDSSSHDTWQNERLDSQTQIVPLDSIHVKHSVDVTGASKQSSAALPSPYEFPAPPHVSRM